jgi:hypothetical protein
LIVIIYRAIRLKMRKMKPSLLIPREGSLRKAKDEASNVITVTRLVILKTNAGQKAVAMKAEGQSAEIRRTATKAPW